jgi:PPOX class probable F420-dependent enzyme
MNVPAASEPLLEARVARLATVDERGRPHIVPIVFAYDAERLYTPVDAKPKSVTPARLRRLMNIAANPEVQVLIDHYEEDWSQLQYVQLRGRAVVLESGDGWENGCRLLEAKYPQYESMPLAGRPIIQMEIEEIVSWGWPEAAVLEG